MNKNNFLGKWYICEMEMWDKDYMDAETKAYILFDNDGLGEFQFGYVHGFILYQCFKKDEDIIVEFSWEGNDESDYASGGGYSKIIGNDIVGNIFFNNGDSSEFKAVK